MKNSRIVLDASAFGALIFREPEAGEIELKVEGALCFAPSLIDYEMGSIFMKKLEIYQKERKTLHDCFDLYHQFPFDRLEIAIEPVAELARKARLSFYDASYLWLAQELGAALITLDKKLQRASQSK